MKDRFHLHVILLMVLIVLASIVKFNYKDSSIEVTVLWQKQTDKPEEILEVPYQKDGIEASYPKFITGGTPKEIEQWNQLIYKDFSKILDIYSFQPIPGPTPTKITVIPTILNINNSIKINNNKFVSILYKASYSSQYSAHPSELIYTTNIDKNNNKRLQLKDYIEINKAFVKDFRTWQSINSSMGNEELDNAVRDYLASLSDEDLLKGFQAADQIGSKNTWEIYSYITPDKIGISLGGPHYLGDHIEFEKDYKELKEFLKSDFPLN